MFHIPVQRFEYKLSDFQDYKVLKKNSVDNLRYTGSPGLAMEILSDSTQYFFHDIEREALDDVEAYARQKGLQKRISTYHCDSIRSFMANDYLVDENDFIFIDPYNPFDTNETGCNFFNVFQKAITAWSKTLLANLIIPIGLTRLCARLGS